MSENVTISVIVPYHKSSERFFNDCIYSILLMDNILECLIVYDCGLPVNRFQSVLSDKRIRMLPCMYVDQSSKRNVGLKEAKGDYICFVDADDVLDTNFLSNSIKVIEKYKVDLVVYGATTDLALLGSKMPKSGFVVEGSAVQNYIYSELNGRLDKIAKIFNPVWGKLFKKSFIVENNIEFCKGLRVGEDSVFVRTYGLYVNSMYINLDYLSYYWRQNPNSTSNTLNNGYFDIESYFTVLKKVMVSNHKDFGKNWDSFVLNICESSFDRMITFYRNKIVTKNDIINCFKKNYKNAPIIKNAYKNIHKKGKTYNYIKFVILHNAFFLLRPYLMVVK